MNNEFLPENYLIMSGIKNTFIGTETNYKDSIIIGTECLNSKNNDSLARKVYPTNVECAEFDSRHESTE
jgi:hypothetical protein